VILSDGTLRDLMKCGELEIGPLNPEQVQPASVDVRLARDFRVFRSDVVGAIDPYETDDLTELVGIPEGCPFVLHPGEFVLGCTVEAFRLPARLVARVEGKSSLGRLGLVIHSTAGFIDPGFRGQITLELSNVAPRPILLWPGMRVGQVAFSLLDQPAVRPYGHPSLGSKYQGQSGPVASRYGRNARPEPASSFPSPRLNRSTPRWR
jgi:dCTP deaminase